jgi:DNA-binding transcriptional MerR regulator
MRDHYRISEISKIYGIGVDSLRYYERIGILKPIRGKNGYRFYSLNDIFKLNIIKDLRQLNFSIKDIKEYLDDQSTMNTLSLLQDEQELIEKQMESLRTVKQSICYRKDKLKNLYEMDGGKFTVKSIPERFCLRLSDEITYDEGENFALNKLHRRQEDKIQDLSSYTMGAILRGGHISIFCILNEKSDQYDFVLPGGQYLSIFYRGDHDQATEKKRDILTYAGNAGFHVSGEPFELYHIDSRFTAYTEELLTEIQVRLL